MLEGGQCKLPGRVLSYEKCGSLEDDNKNIKKEEQKKVPPCGRRDKRQRRKDM